MKKSNLKVLDANVAALLERQKNTPRGIVSMNSQRPVSAAIEDQVMRVVNSLDDFSTNVKACQDKQLELNARTLELEQKVLAGRGWEPSSGDSPNVASSMVETLSESQAFASVREWNQGTARVRVTASIRAIVGPGHGDSSTGSMPSNPERGRVVLPVMAPMRLLQALPSRPTDRDSVEHVRLHVAGDAAVQVRQGDEKAEIDFEGELVKAEIATIAAHTTASKQVLEDASALQSNIDLVIRGKLVTKLENRIINDNSASGIVGLMALAVAAVSTIADTPADRIGEAINSLQTLGYNPNLVVMNPIDWFTICITKSLTEGTYVFGSPLAPVPQVLWRLPVVLTPGLAAGTTLVLDTAFITVLDREAPSVMISNSHKDYFTRNLVAILGELRAGLEVLDALAITSVDLYSS